ncbi:bifunctional phosphopantothenoylcysteine decarboxylase/phosphopantothenate--cysteine ligase CoaBC [Alteribacillus sp. HJP-4]|uniref:bifunctional phosphopantothenoylcysteine decarboxylase/phosphopantothenate--cysteine ligase CoaBC n=1 Tax=Alteribacillus sp. HJP-4 TaxID=2775394 RepID=UPI0035CD19F9
MLENKHIVLAVSGGIAAFKAAALASRLTQAGAEVKVIMTEHAKNFVTPLTFQALTRHRVYDDTFAEKDPEKVAHIDIADWAEIVVVAPATANCLEKLASGSADDMLSTTLLATLAPIYAAPAMNVNMYNHPAVQRNMKKLKEDGVRFLEAGEGYLACGWVGKGRMAEPEDIIASLEQDLGSIPPLTGQRILVTAGPTYEYADPVRVFTNPSTGKMGFALAAEAAALGAEVTLISGPVQLQTPAGVTRVDVTTAEQMYREVMSRYDSQDAVIKAAAVSDYRPAEIQTKKMKKQTEDVTIPMERTKDILAALGERKQHQVLVGFAAESHEITEYAEEKMKNKKLDMVIANNITADNAGFRSDTNQIIILEHGKSPDSLPLLSKSETAQEVLKRLTSLIKKED